MPNTTDPELIEILEDIKVTLYSIEHMQQEDIESAWIMNIMDIARSMIVAIIFGFGFSIGFSIILMITK